MRSRVVFTLSLSLAAVLLQAGCSAESAETQNPREPGTRSAGSSNTVVLPEGTVLVVRTTTALSTKSQQAGHTFAASLEQALMHAGREIAAKGARVEGTIVDADKGGRVKEVASLTVGLTGLEVNGKSVDISTNSVTQTAGTTKRKDAAEIGIGAGVGAAIGAIAGGGKGAAIGAAAGAGAGTGVVLATRGQPAVIPSESVLTFQLRAPATFARR